jgi:hypothetical protein
MMLFLLNEFDPNPARLFEKACDAGLDVVISAARGEGWGKAHAEDLLDRANNLHDYERVDIGLASAHRPWPKHILRTNLSVQCVADTGLDFASREARIWFEPGMDAHESLRW